MTSGRPQFVDLEHRKLQMRPWTLRALKQRFVAEEQYTRAMTYRNVFAWIAGIVLFFSSAWWFQGLDGWEVGFPIGAICVIVAFQSWVRAKKSAWAVSRAMEVLQGEDPITFGGVAMIWRGWVTLEADSKEFFEESDHLDSEDVEMTEIMNPRLLQMTRQFMNNKRPDETPVTKRGGQGLTQGDQ